MVTTSKKKMMNLINDVSGLFLDRINEHADQGGKAHRGLANEGYDAGYFQALQDVLLLMNGVLPGRREWKTASEKQDLAVGKRKKKNPENISER